MFLSHVAFALELISLTMGALLVLKSCRSYGCNEHPVVTTTYSTDHPTDLPKKVRRHHGFLKFIGYLVIILSVLSLVCTTISYICYLDRYGFMEESHHNYNSKDLPQENHFSPDNPNPSMPPN